MKILVINTHDIAGGSAIAAYRLCKRLEELYSDVDIHFVVGSKQSNDGKIYCTRKKVREFWFERILDRYLNKLGLQYFWFPHSSSAIKKYTQKLNPDIIYLRNIHGGYFQTSLLPELSKMAPVLWTLSDMWSFTGHCAHTFGDMSWKYMKSGCNDLSMYPPIGRDTGEWLLKRKKKIYQKTRMKIVTPSKWLYNLARQSPVFEDKDIIQIYNGFNLNVFRPKDKASCRNALGIPEEANTIMFSSVATNSSPYKGGNDLLQILKILNETSLTEIHAIIVGKGDVDPLNLLNNIIVHKMDYIQNDIIMAACLSAADIMIYPTRADNLPNVLIESISCGLPCVTFDIGGCSEIIKNQDYGFVIEPFDHKDFASKVMQLLQNDLLRNKFSEIARSNAEKLFNQDRMCADYYRVFSDLILSLKF